MGAEDRAFESLLPELNFNMQEINYTSFKSPKKLAIHSFHIVDPSPWPLATGFSVFFMVFGLTRHIHNFSGGLTLFFIGLILSVVNASIWWRDVVREATFEGQHTNAVQDGLRFGMMLFIVSEIRLFFAFFWAYFHASFNPTPALGAVWPPKGLNARDPWMIPLLNTGLLLTSGASLTWSHAALVGGYHIERITSLVVTLIFATIFTLFQLFEYTSAQFTISDGVYGSTFYRLTGLHGFHVIVGTLFLLVSLVRSIRHHYTQTVHIGFECAAWYWHFVDVVWIMLFLAIYVWGNSVNL